MLGDTSDAATAPRKFLERPSGIRHFRQGSSLKTWLYRIAIREALNQSAGSSAICKKTFPLTRTEEGQARIETRISVPPLFEQLAAQEIHVAVQGALQQIPDVFRSA